MMKGILRIVLLLALIAQSCTRETPKSAVTESKTTIEVIANLDDMTRTYYDGNTIQWAETKEQLNIIYYADDNSSSLAQTQTHADYTIDAEGRITFTADFSTTYGATSYTLGAFYPYAEVRTTLPIKLTIPQHQTPTADSYDPKTDILVSKSPVTIDGTPESVQLSFSRMVAFAKMTLKGIGAGEIIKSVTFSSSAKPVGSVEFQVHEADTVNSAKWYNNYEDIYITRDNWVATGEDVVWMTTAPTDLSGTDFTVTVVTDKCTYIKIVDLTDRTLTFERGDIAIFSVNLPQPEPSQSITGTWYLTEWCGTEPSFDVYMSIDDDYSVTLLQRIESREWERYESVATYTNGIISGTYTDGVAWRASYRVTFSGDTMTWTDTADASDISVYTRTELPDFIADSATRSQENSVYFL